jgi:outer membrane protein assembly factor BamB
MAWFCPAVVPVLVGPLQVLLTLLPGLIVALFGGLLGLFRPSGFKNALKLLWRQKIAVVCVIAVGAGLFYGVKALWPGGAGEVVTAALAGDDWPTARFDLRRCGVAPGSASPVRPTVVWSFRNDGFFASPAVVGNRVYVASANIGAFKKTGKIYCFDADTGAVVWSKAPPEYRATFSSPVVKGNYLVCGEGLHDTRDARVICLDLRPGHEGEVIWTFRTKNHVECTPVISGGRVYVGAGDDGYYCLDLEPDADGQAKVHWHKPGDAYPDAETSLAVHDDKVYAGLGNTGKALAVLDALTGAELHRLEMPYPVFSPPAIADGKLYVGMGDGDYVVAGQGGEVRCLDLASLKTLWTFPLPQTVLGAVAVKEDKLYFGCGDQHVYCLSREGKLLGKRDTHERIKTSPAVTEQHVFVVNDAGSLLAYDRHTLEPVWEARLGSAGLFISSPVVARGHVYVGTQSDGFLCVGKPASSKRVPSWSAPLGGAGMAGNADDSPLPEVGEVAWRLGDHVVAAAVWDEALYVPVAGPKRHGLVSLPIGKNDREAPTPSWFAATDAAVRHAPVLLGQVAAVVAGQHGAANRKLHFIDRRTGAALQTYPIESGSSGMLAASLEQFLVQDRVDSLTSIDREGEKQWSVTIGRLLHAPAVSPSMIVAATAEPSAVIALDRATGAELWQAPLGSAAVATPILDKTAFLVATQSGLERRWLVDGRRDEAWTCAGGVPSGELAVAGSQVLFVNQQGEVVVVERATGKVAGKAAGAAVGATPLVSRGMVIYPAAGRLMSFLLTDREPFAEPWLEWPAELKEAPLPRMLLRDSRVYAALGEAGFACLGRAP